MEADHPCKNEDGKLAILDMNVWIDPDAYIVYQHYQKPVASKQVLAAQSAQSTSCKRNVHVRELVRRILNTSRRLEWETMVAPVLMEYLGRMMMAGYNEPYRKVTLERALAIFDKMKQRDLEGTEPMNRPKDWQVTMRRKKKQKKKNNWSTRGGYLAPIIIPSTPNSELLKMLREVAANESEQGLRFRIQEKGGTTIKNLVQRSNPTVSPGCQDGGCMACQSEGGGGNCRKSNVQYEMSCNLCPSDNPSLYIGETARNLFTRSKEHLANYASRNRESFMRKHQVDHHYGAEAAFSAKVTASFQDCLSRQVSEGVYIRRNQNTTLNSKSEWHQPALWRVRSEIAND